MFSFLGSKRKSQTTKIGKEFIKSLSQISLLISKGKRNEEETRRWCVDILKSAFGWDGSEIETELSVLGKRVDIALKEKASNRVLVVVECKAATVNITNAAINQAASYATSLNAEWAVVTNGHQWLMFHVAPTTTGIEPDMMLIFDVALLDEDGVSKEDISELYFLTKNALLSGETLNEFHINNCMSSERIFDALLSDDIVKAVSRKLEDGYRKHMAIDVSVDPKFIRDMLADIRSAYEAL